MPRSPVTAVVRSVQANRFTLLLAAVCCSTSYIFSLHFNTRGADPNAKFLHSSLSTPVDCSAALSGPVDLDFEPHHTAEAFFSRKGSSRPFPACPLLNPVPRGAAIDCLVPTPAGYNRAGVPWPESLDAVWAANAPEAARKAIGTGAARMDGDKVRFADNAAYVERVTGVLRVGAAVRTALDIDCGVASWGARLLSRGLLTMSLARQEPDGAPVQLALERGVPAMLGELSASRRLPFPARAFDVVHCADCDLHWLQPADGLYFIEIDRVLRPGGIWIASGKAVKQQSSLEKMVTQLCWEKAGQQGDIVAWKKPINHARCKLHLCDSDETISAWNDQLDHCVTPLPPVSRADQVAGGSLEAWPQRLAALPPRIQQGSISGISSEVFVQDSELWKRRLRHYKSAINQLGHKGQYRNIIDMNAQLGGFAAALVDDPVWVMNVVPAAVTTDTLGMIYERGLIGTYHNWCEAMPTYPRSYDIVHAHGVLTMYRDRCDAESILLEIERILRPGGAAIIRDDAEALAAIKNVVDGMPWETMTVEVEDSPSRDKLMVVAKAYSSTLAAGAGGR